MSYLIPCPVHYYFFSIFVILPFVQVLYTDGDKEILNLNKERWILIDDVCIDQVGN